MKKTAPLATSLLFALWLSPAWADDAATHYNMGLQLKRQGKIPDGSLHAREPLAVAG
jgi:hypothetical protein